MGLLCPLLCHSLGAASSVSIFLVSCDEERKKAIEGGVRRRRRQVAVGRAHREHMEITHTRTASPPISDL